MFVMKRSSNDPVTYGGNLRLRQTTISSLTSMSASQEQRLVQDSCVPGDETRLRVMVYDCEVSKSLSWMPIRSENACSIFELDDFLAISRNVIPLSIYIYVI